MINDWQKDYFAFKNNPSLHFVICSRVYKKAKQMFIVIVVSKKNRDFTYTLFYNNVFIIIIFGQDLLWFLNNHKKYNIWHVLFCDNAFL